MEGKPPRTPAIRRLSRIGRYTGLPDRARAPTYIGVVTSAQKMLMVSL